MVMAGRWAQVPDARLSAPSTAGRPASMVRSTCLAVDAGLPDVLQTPPGWREGPVAGRRSARPAAPASLALCGAADRCTKKCAARQNGRRPRAGGGRKCPRIVAGTSNRPGRIAVGPSCGNSPRPTYDGPREEPLAECRRAPRRAGQCGGAERGNHSGTACARARKRPDRPRAGGRGLDPCAGWPGVVRGDPRTGAGR